MWFSLGFLSVFDYGFPKSLVRLSGRTGSRKPAWEASGSSAFAELLERFGLCSQQGAAVHLGSWRFVCVFRVLEMEALVLQLVRPLSKKPKDIPTKRTFCRGSRLFQGPIFITAQLWSLRLQTAALVRLTRTFVAPSGSAPCVGLFWGAPWRSFSVVRRRAARSFGCSKDFFFQKASVKRVKEDGKKVRSSGLLEKEEIFLVDFSRITYIPLAFGLPGSISRFLKSEAMAAAPMKVAIIGAGLGGLTLAKTLLEGGVEVCLYEAWEEWKARGGALGLQGGKHILQSLGLGEELAAVANDNVQIQYHANGKHLGNLNLPGCIAMRKDLQKLLVNSLPSGVIKLGHKLVDIIEGDDEVLLTFENGARASANLLVAADGIHSFVRQRIFGVDHPVFTGYRMLYSVSSKHFRPEPSVNQIHWTEVEGVGYGILELTAGQGTGRHDICALILGTEEEVTDRWDSTMVKERFAQVAQHIGPNLPMLQAAVENSEVCFDWGIYQSAKLPSWISAKGRTVLLGDAAHATAPFMGQGANMAMQDAYCLGQILLNPKLSLSDGLQLYEDSRKAYCESIVARSSTMGQVHTAAGLKASLRNHFFTAFVMKSMRAVFANDLMKQKPWDTQESLIRQFGKRIGNVCSSMCSL